jgi:hypothetical protein
MRALDCAGQEQTARISEGIWRRRPDLNRGWRFCRFHWGFYFVGSSCSLVSGDRRFTVVFGRSWTEVGLKFRGRAAQRIELNPRIGDGGRSAGRSAHKKCPRWLPRPPAERPAAKHGRNRAGTGSKTSQTLCTIWLGSHPAPAQNPPSGFAQGVPELVTAASVTWSPKILNSADSRRPTDFLPS